MVKSKGTRCIDVLDYVRILGFLNEEGLEFCI